MPQAISIVTKELPPYEKNGKGIPVRGTSATIEEIFKNACPPIQETIQIANILENLSGARLAI